MCLCVQVHVPLLPTMYRRLSTIELLNATTERTKGILLYYNIIIYMYIHWNASLHVNLRIEPGTSQPIVCGPHNHSLVSLLQWIPHTHYSIILSVMHQLSVTLAEQIISPMVKTAFAI